MELTEKVQAGLKCCQQCRLDDDEHFYVQECENCPYRAQWTEAHEHCADTLMRDAAALIREQKERIRELETAQKPRLLSLEEVKQLPMGAVVWREYKWTDEDDGTIHLDFLPVMRSVCCGNPVLVDGESEEPLANLVQSEKADEEAERYWTARPTDEQRKEAKWE